jgi:hypothetical protein
VNETLDYAPPPQLRKQPYWVILFAVWIASVPIVSVLDQGMKSYLYGGGPADGQVTMLAMLAIAPAAIIASFLKRRWWVAAIVGGACAPVAVVAMYLLWR